MKRAAGFGLLMLTISAAGWGGEMAWGAAPVAAAGRFFIGSSAHGGQGYLGVDVRDVTSDELAVLKVKDTHGAEIVLVDHDAPAGKADLRVHDVVLQMNGQAIEGQDQLRRMLRDSPPGRQVQFVISRDGMQMTITTQMASREAVERQAWEQHLTGPDPAGSTTDADEGSYAVSPAPAPPVRGNSFLGSMLMNPSYTGAILEKMSTQLADFFGVSSGTGLLVRSVVPNSPASDAGMRAGDVVVRANSRPVVSTNDWAKLIKSSHGQALSVVVIRDKKEQTLTLIPDAKKRSDLESAPSASDVLVAGLGIS